MTGHQAQAPHARSAKTFRAAMAATALMMGAAGPVDAGATLDEPSPPPLIAYARNVGDTIWMTETGGGTSRQLTTHRSGDPAWSPDGTRIAYTRYQGSTYDGVWIMNPDGTGQQRLTNGLTGGPNWSPNSTDLAYTNPVGIGLVNAHTGASRQLTVNSDRHPAWSPDGTLIMFSRFERGVWVMDAQRAEQEQQLAIEARHAVWSPGSDQVAYVNHHLEGIHIMSADGASKRRITADGGVFPQWSPDGTRIAYTGRTGYGIWSIDADGAHRRQISLVGRGPAWSPDGTRIAFTRPDGIWITDPDGESLQRLTNHGKGPVWSPDGTRILYTSHHLDGIYGIESDGVNQRQIASGGSDPQWSPNGRRLAFTRRDGIWVMDHEGEDRLRLTPEYTEGPVWSPDGTRIAYTTRFGGIHLVDANGANPRMLSSDGADPTWSPDGTLLAFVTAEEHSGWASGSNRAIYVMDADGANPRILASDGSDPAWSPDGTRIAYTTRSGEILVSRADGREPQPTHRYGTDPTWSPDGKRLAYVGNYGGVFSMNADGAGHRTVTLQTGMHPRWSPDGARIAYQTDRGPAVIRADGTGQLHLAEIGAAPAWRPSPHRSPPSTPPPADASSSCSPDHSPQIPRFLPLWTRITSQAPQAVSGPFEIMVEFSRPVTGFLAGDILVSNGRVTDLVDCGETFHARISPASVGAVVVRIPRNVVRDITHKGNLASSPLVRIGVSQTPPATGGLDTWDRPTVSRHYTEEFGAGPPEMGYTGNVSDCLPGSTSLPFRTDVIRRVNWYRQMAGLAMVTERIEYSELAQRAAMMMAAEGDLSHRPGPGWACHTASGSDAAARSNLLLGAVGAEAVDGYMRNRGLINRSVGHRRLLLHPYLPEIGVGDIPGQNGQRPANALYIPEQNLWDPHPRVREPRGFVAWPPAGYVPAGTVWSRWSFSRAGADFSEASVTVTHDFGSVPTEILTRNSSSAGSRNVPDPSIVWNLPGFGDSSPPAGRVGGDLCLSVTVAGVRIEGRIQTPYEYVTCIIPSRAPGPFAIVSNSPPPR